MKRFVLIAILALAGSASHAQSGKPLLLREPTLSKTQIAFIYGGDIWLVSREGGDAIRLTSGTGSKAFPRFSPDGSQIAFTADYEGKANVYVVPVAGGIPRRVTYEPGPDLVSGWTNDGKNILFASTRDSSTRGIFRLFTVPVGGGFATALPLPRAWEGSYSEDGSHLAYRPVSMPFGTWSHYRGGTSSAIWIANLSDSQIERVPRKDSVDLNPIWIGDAIYFLSDRNGIPTIYTYDTKSKEVTEVIPNHGLPIKNMSAGPGAIVYEQFGAIHLYDLSAHREHAVEIRVADDLPETRPHFDNVVKQIQNAVISPTGVRAAFEAHNEILTAPADKGDIRNITNTPGVAERDPAWSPDGKSIAYFSDESGEYELHIRDQNGMGDVRKFNLGNPPSFFYSPQWSPDSKKIAYTDKRLSVWYIDLEKRTPVKVDTEVYEEPQRHLDPSWSPDSRWITYSKTLANHLRGVFVYSLETGKAMQVTDGLSDARYAVFDKGGKYLYFTASTDIGPTTGWLDLSSFGHDVTRSVYVAVLRKDLPSPLAPESDEEKPPSAKSDQSDAKKKDDGGAKPEGGEDKDSKDAKDKTKPEEPVKVTIDFDGISQRILALPIPARDYAGLAAGKTGELYPIESERPPAVGGDGGAPPGLSVYRFELKTRKTEPLISGVQSFDVSFDGEKFLYSQGESWNIHPTSGHPMPGAKPDEGHLKIEGMEVRIDPRAEWAQMYNEIWRIERDFFYDPHHHGMSIDALKAKYEQYLDRLGSRSDLNYLFQQMLGELNVGHMFVGGGDIPEPKEVHVGLLGADYTIENGRYRFARIYNGENWDTQLKAPLTQPGVNALVGEYLLAVNGKDVRGSDDVFSFFQETAGKQVSLKVGPKPDGTGSRDVTVVPVESDTALRNRAWVEDNRR
ncbi:MAG: PDZ domain-containing protein, partial [Candidatus Acidiferrales bacterium]